jgi:hypothetical protein
VISEKKVIGGLNLKDALFIKYNMKTVLLKT